MPAGFAAPDEDSMLIIFSDVLQPAQIRSISIDGVAASNDLNAAVAAGFLVQLGKFIGNSTTTLSETYDY
jgi:sorbitol-specific phosphotransferase system component IIA